MPARFLQVHTLTSYPATLLNRDDAGFAKRIEFGDGVRTRISSQCLKRHWRTFDGPRSLKSLGQPLAYRSRITFEQKITQPLLEKKVAEEPVVRAVVNSLMKIVLGQSAKAEKAAAEGDEADKPSVSETAQVTVLGPKEVGFLLEVAGQVAKATKPGKDMAKQAEKAIKELIDKDGRKNLEALGKGVGLDAAMFGRMVTGDVLARVDAAVHVAHAFTVHKQQSEADYFSAIDELKRERGGEDAQGSGHINSSELTSGLYYGYVVIDVPLMLANLEGTKPDDWQKADRKLARDVVGSLLHSITTVSPGAKLGSTAPHSSAHLLLVESGDAQPRTLANAFMKAVRTDDDVLAASYRRLADFIVDLEQMYPSQRFARRLAALGDARALLDAIGQKEKLSVDAIAEWSREQV